MKIWIDVTTSCRWVGAPVGIVRSEVEIAMQLRDLDDSRIQFCRYDEPSGRYFAISREALPSVIGSGVGRVPQWSPEWTWARVSGGVRRRAASLFPARELTLRERHPFGEGDVYVSTGMDAWDKDMALLSAIKRQTGIRVITTCYDLIPIRYPNLVNDFERDVIPRHMHAAVELSDAMLCISEHTRTDVADFMREHHLRSPVLERIRLGSSVPVRSTPTARASVDTVDGGFVLFVSSLVRRKNHEILYRAYRRLLATSSLPVPRMLWVGKISDEVRGTLQDARLDPVIGGRIEVRENVGDAELADLYERSLFTVYPTLCEGWGLPVAESASYGKFCLASDVPSIREIAPDLHEYLDPWELSAWTERLGHYFAHPEQLEARNRRVAAAGLRFCWSDTATQIMDVVERQAAARSRDG